MFSLQQFEEAEERVHAWHDEMKHCVETQGAQNDIARRSWFAALGHCLGYIGGWHTTASTEVEGSSPASVSPIHTSR